MCFHKPKVARLLTKRIDEYQHMWLYHPTRTKWDWYTKFFLYVNTQLKVTVLSVLQTQIKLINIYLKSSRTYRISHGGWCCRKNHWISSKGNKGFWKTSSSETGYFPNGILLLEVINRNTPRRCGIYSKLTIMTAERRNWRRCVASTVNFERI